MDGPEKHVRAIDRTNPPTHRAPGISDPNCAVKPPATKDGHGLSTAVVQRPIAALTWFVPFRVPSR
ncbi:hypothetical protein SRM_01913 [Salinibacter ruber M8]|uniref:Uncharacterized protein n=1 Tax=Salinibacter ruber (strain M8) TaxID=761659 RepID=D5H9X9_SALRM|nr:hypothetical protein SRM_01913 [Salinibacter ruber M8]